MQVLEGSPLKLQYAWSQIPPSMNKGQLRGNHFSCHSKLLKHKREPLNLHDGSTAAVHPTQAGAATCRVRKPMTRRLHHAACVQVLPSCVPGQFPSTSRQPTCCKRHVMIGQDPKQSQKCALGRHTSTKRPPQSWWQPCRKAHVMFLASTCHR